MKELVAQGEEIAWIQAFGKINARKLALTLWISNDDSDDEDAFHGNWSDAYNNIEHVNSANGEDEETCNAVDGGSEGSASSDDLVAGEERHKRILRIWAPRMEVLLKPSIQPAEPSEEQAYLESGAVESSKSDIEEEP
jgi:hypothetical protein